MNDEDYLYLKQLLDSSHQLWWVGRDKWEQITALAVDHRSDQEEYDEPGPVAYLFHGHYIALDCTPLEDLRVSSKPQQIQFPSQPSVIDADFEVR